MSKKKKGKGKKASARYKAPTAARTKLIAAASNGTRRALAKKPAAKKGPRSQALPGMERVRNTKLDGYCEDARDGLVSIDEGTSAVADAKLGAMRELQRIGRSSYVHAGVRFTHTPGVDKVSVKRIKETEFTGASPAAPTENLTVAERSHVEVEQDEVDRDGVADYDEPGVSDVH